MIFWEGNLIKELFKRIFKCNDKQSEINIDFESEFKSLEKETIFITPCDFKTNSHIGGLPFVEMGFTWPTAYIEKSIGNSEDNTTNYMELLIDIDLAEMNKFDTEHLLPDHGHLCVFYDMEAFPLCNEDSEEGVKVFYFENPTIEIDAIPPQEGEVRQIYKRHNITFKSGISVPCFDEYSSNLSQNIKYYDEGVRLGYFKDEESEYDTHLFGYATFMQGNAKPKGDYILLMQIDSYYFGSGDELNLGDAGQLYIYITKEDLKNRNFKNIKYDLQCG